MRAPAKKPPENGVNTHDLHQKRKQNREKHRELRGVGGDGLRNKTGKVVGQQPWDDDGKTSGVHP